MNPKGKVQAPKVTEIIERHCPVGWIPAWDPDEAGSEWWYDKSKYFQTAPIPCENAREVCSNPPVLPENIPKAVLAWYAQQNGDQALQPTGIDHSKAESKLSAAHFLVQPLHGAGLTNLSPEMQTFNTNAHRQQIQIPRGLASEAAAKGTSLHSTPAVPCSYSRRRQSFFGTAFAASNPHHSTGFPGLESSSTPADRGLAELKHLRMPSLDPNEAHSGHSVAGDQYRRVQSSSLSLQHLVQPTRNGCIGTPTTAMSENAKLYPIANITQPTGTSSGRPMSVTSTTTMVRQPTSVLGPALERQGPTHTGPLSRAPSTTSSAIAATDGAEKQTRGSSRTLGRNSALDSATALVNARKLQSHLGNITTTPRPAVAHAPHTSAASGKRLRFLYEECSDTDIERPTKCRRTSQNLQMIPENQPPYHNNISGCAVSISRLTKGMPSANHSNDTDCIGHQRVSDPIQKGNVSISKADLVRNLVPGDSEVFADPRDPLVQEYIDAYTHNWLRGYRQMRAMSAQNQTYQGVGVQLDRPKALYNLQTSFVKGPASALSQGIGSINNTAIVKLCDSTEVVGSIRTS